ncbi:unnamed protein product [Oppiella nova]|uniref:Uncharacterized protein n=1 Tax=Oppiella nova TaxID=334625 RepID=A0A7R9M0Y3_9ACAR|nr:unnamed protein product [Oppiella nova]CAG2168630.1 unnamed protein product [Oppiella nova]
MKHHIQCIIVFTLVSGLSVHNCSPIDTNDTNKSTDNTMSTDSVVTTESKGIVTTDKTIAETTVKTNDGEKHPRVARHQTDNPVESQQTVTNTQKSDAKTPYDEPDVSDQNIHEIKVQTRGYQKTTEKPIETQKSSDEDLNTSATDSVSVSSEENSTDSNDAIATTNRD